MLRFCKTRYSRNCIPATVFASLICSNSSRSSSGLSRRFPESFVRSYKDGSKSNRTDWKGGHKGTFNPRSGSRFTSQTPHFRTNAVSFFSVNSMIISESGSLISSCVHSPSINLSYQSWKKHIICRITYFDHTSSNFTTSPLSLYNRHKAGYCLLSIKTGSTTDRRIWFGSWKNANRSEVRPNSEYSFARTVSTTFLPLISNL